ncbi:hypothetical protein BGX26_007668 [Mortierella sp. AD094]|nr:hypothetical protein BGX26_007668 [Mortierella sp. AD094]
MVCVSANTTTEFTELTPLGTILATPIKHWILEGRAPVPSIPDWTMRSIFRVRDGQLQLLPAHERAPGYRNHRGLVSHIEQGYLRLQPMLDRFRAGTDNILVEEHTDDFASRINAIRIVPTTDDMDVRGTFAKASTR